MKTQISIKRKKSRVKDRSILTTTHSSTTESLKRSDRFISKLSFGIAVFNFQTEQSYINKTFL